MIDDSTRLFNVATLFLLLKNKRVETVIFEQKQIALRDLRDQSDLKKLFACFLVSVFPIKFYTRNEF